MFHEYFIFSNKNEFVFMVRRICENSIEIVFKKWRHELFNQVLTNHKEFHTMILNTYEQLEKWILKFVDQLR